jgi:hypothetical protein
MRSWKNENRISRNSLRDLDFLATVFSHRGHRGHREENENYKLQITNYKQITNYNDQNYKPGVLGTLRFKVLYYEVSSKVVPMGNTFLGCPRRGPWPPEA